MHPINLLLWKSYYMFNKSFEGRMVQPDLVLWQWLKYQRKGWAPGEKQPSCLASSQGAQTRSSRLGPFFVRADSGPHTRFLKPTAANATLLCTQVSKHKFRGFWAIILLHCWFFTYSSSSYVRHIPLFAESSFLSGYEVSDNCVSGHEDVRIQTMEPACLDWTLSFTTY